MAKKSLSSRLTEVTGFLNRTDGSLRSKILRSGFWQALATIGVNGLAFAKSAILARMLSPEAFGLMSLTLMIITGAQRLTETGLGSALVQRKGSFDEAKDTAFTLLGIRGVLLSVLIVPVAYGMAVFYEKPELFALITICGLSFLFSGFSNIQLMASIKELDFKKVAIIENAVAITSFIVAIVCAYFMRSVWALVLGFLAAGLIKSLLSYVVVPGRPRFGWNPQIARELFNYGKYITASTMLLFMAAEIDTAVIGKMLDASALGYYSVAFLLANFPPTHVAFVISNIMFPAYSKIQDDRALLKQTFSQVTHVVASLILPVMAGMSVVSPLLINAFYGAGWEPAIEPFRVLCIFGAMSAIATVNGYMFNAIGRPDMGFRISVIRMAAIVICIVPAIRLGGIVGAAVAMSATMLISMVHGLYYVTKVLSMSVREVLRPLWNSLLKSAAVALPIYGLQAYVLTGERFDLLWVMLLGAVIYLPLNLDLVSMVMKRKK